MDKEVLVSAGQELVRLLDETAIKPRAAMWILSPENDIWRLWIVPATSQQDKHEFYRVISETISRNRAKLHGLDTSDVELVKDTHPAMQGMKRFIKMDGLGSVHMSNNRFNDFFLPDGIVLRMAID